MSDDVNSFLPEIMNRETLATELDAELHRCWTKHVNAPYDKSAFQALQRKVEEACAALRSTRSRN